MTYDSYSYDVTERFGDEESCGRNDPYHPEHVDYGGRFDDLDTFYGEEVSPIDALRHSTYDYGLEECLGNHGSELGVLYPPDLRERLERRSRGVLRDAHIPSTLEEVEAILGVYGEGSIRTPAAAAHLVDRLIDIHEDMRERAVEHPELDDYPVSHALRRVPMYDLTAIAAGLRQIFRTYVKNKADQARTRLLQLRAALAALLHMFWQAALLDALRHFLLPDEPADATPRPIYAKPRPPSAPLAPPV